jgi:hypothetical protein
LTSQGLLRTLFTDGAFLGFGNALLGHALGSFALLAQTIAELGCAGARSHGRRLGNGCTRTRLACGLLGVVGFRSLWLLGRLLEFLGYLRQLLAYAQTITPAALHALRARLGVILIHHPIRFYIASTGLTPRR